MGGGIISLVANGAQDVYLTGSPQITYFKVIYRRYTNFAMETIEQAIDSARPGGRYSVQVQRNGDLATKTALRIKLPAVRSDVLADQTGSVAWVRRLGHALISSVEVKIGGMTIDKHVGTWMDIFYELTHTCEEERGYRNLIGDTEELTTLTKKVSSSGVVETLLPEATLYIPFQFWFCRNYGLALPLIALQYHEVRIDISLQDVSLLMCWTGTAAPNMGNYQFKDAGVMIDYVYLESGERRKYAQLGHEYLIEQVQHTGAESVQINASSSSNSQNFKLNYNHPTKELVWALRVGAFSGEGNKSSFSGGRGRFLTYVNDDAAWKTVGVDNAAKNLAEGCVFVYPENSGVPALESDRENRLSRAGATVAATINGQEAHLCSVALNPNYNGGERIKVNLVNRNDARIDSSGATDQVNNDYNITVYAYNTSYNNIDFALLSLDGVELSDAIDSAVVNVYHTDGKDVKIECVEVRHSLSLTDVSIPIEDFTTDLRSTSSAQYCVHQDVTVTQFNNYGLRLDGKGNPVQSGNLQLNGHDRFKVQEGGYFNYYQTKNHHTRTPADGVNVYSFALHPEKHQPSGTTNLSRIDSTILNLNFSDSLRANTALKLDIARDSKLYIFAFSYNVLRVMSGMAGLAYSN
jgi:hypothetical protein